MKNRPIKIPRRIRAIGWSSFWCDGQLGWSSSSFLSARSPEARPRLENGKAHGYAGNLQSGDTFVRCEFIIRPLRDKRGRVITCKIK